MAYLLKSRTLWDRRNTREQSIVKLTPDYADVLRKKRPELMKIVRPDQLWGYLRKYQVLDKGLEDRLKLNATDEDMVGRLLDHLEREPSWQLHAFLRSCRLSRQEHIIRLLGLDEENYAGPSPPDSDDEEEPPTSDVGACIGISPTKRACYNRSSPGAVPGHPSSQHRSMSEQQETNQQDRVFTHILVEALTVHSEYYRDNLMTGRVFDFRHHEADFDFYDIDPCYIQQDVDFQKSKRIAEGIKMRDILRKFGRYSTPRTVLLVGPAGAGKSSFFKRFAFSWSKELLKYLQDPAVNPCPELLAVVYVPARSLTTDIWASIERAVKSKQDGKGLLINQIRNGQLSLSLGSSKPKHSDESGNSYTTDDPPQQSRDPKSAFLLDGIDEIRDPEVLKAVQDFVHQMHQEGGPQILVSARTGLSRMDNSIFNRFLHLEGYTLAQGLDYVEKYITQQSQAEPGEKRDCDTTSPSTETTQAHHEHPVLSHLKRNKEKMMHILGNPLRAHILSGLTVEGLIELDDDNVLQSLELLRTMESFFIQRETEGRGVPDKESDQFYRLCLHGLLEGIREFTEDDLEQFNVARSAYVSFLKKQTKRDKAANQITHFSFDHELLYEYFAARAIETLPGGMRKAILLYIASKDILRNLQKLIYSILGEFGIEQSVPLLIGMTQLILLKEALNKRCEYVTENDFSKHHFSEDAERWQVFCKSLQQLFDSIEDSIPAPGDLLQTKGAQDRLDVEAAAAIWEVVDEVFVELTELVKGEQSPGTYGCDVYFILYQGFLKHVVLDLLAELTPQQQEEIAQNTYLKMLPCNEVYPCGSMRWVEVRSDIIYCWSPEDLAAGILLHTERGAHRETTGYLRINFMYSPSQWGHAPDDHWTRGVWDTALQAVVSHYTMTDTLHIYLPAVYSTPLQDLLYSITHLDTSHYPGGNIEIYGGTIRLSDLHQWYQESGVTHTRNITLMHILLQLPADTHTREQLLQWVGEEFLQDVRRHITDEGLTEGELGVAYPFTEGVILFNPDISFM